MVAPMLSAIEEMNVVLVLSLAKFVHTPTPCVLTGGLKMSRVLRNPKSHHRRRTEEEYNDEMEDTIARIIKSKRELDVSITEGEWLSYLGDIGANISDPNVWQYMLEVREKVESSIGVTITQKKN